MRKIALLLIAISFFSCSKNLLPSGYILQTQFAETIPFNFDYGVPIIEVSISGQIHRFLLDTGAPTVISHDLADKLKAKVIKKGKVSDSQGKNRAQDFVLVEEIKIGGLTFHNIGAVVIDFKEAFEIKCLDIDGIIGSNQMSNAIWELDYQKRQVQITDNFASFKEPEGASKVIFTARGNQKTPLVKVQVDSTTSGYLTFDTGANGGINLPYSTFKNVIKDYVQLKSYGTSSSGIYGAGVKDTVRTAKAPFVKFGDLQLRAQLIEFRNASSSLVGNEFLKNFITTINWKTQTIYLQQQHKNIKNTLESMGLGVRFINNKAMIAHITVGSDAENLQLQLGDEVIEIDGVNLSNLTEEQACNYTFNSLFANKNEVALTYKRNNQKHLVKIHRMFLVD